jgi:hypothetical protein
MNFSALQNLRLSVQTFGLLILSNVFTCAVRGGRGLFHLHNVVCLNHLHL